MATWNSTGLPASIQALHDQAATVNGDTITMPAGSFTWTTGITITKAITLQGAGIGQTIILDAIGGGVRLMVITLVANQLTRVTGIEWQNAGSGHSAAPNGAMRVDGRNDNGSQFRMDHCYVNDITGSIVFDTVNGVFDHNHVRYLTCANCVAFYIYGTHWNGDAQGFGDNSWVSPAGFGSGNFMFFEDNNLEFTFGGAGTFTDAYGGGRFVIRNNNPIYNGTINNHGTESTERTRGSRCYECYNNIFTGNNANKFVTGNRSGSYLLHHNTISGRGAPQTQSTTGDYRTENNFIVFGIADGTNSWDVAEQPGPYFTGTAAQAGGGPHDSGSVVVSGTPNWQPNQWVGYCIRRISPGSNPTSAVIDGSTSNSLQYAGDDYTNSSISFALGDSLDIRRLRYVLDGTGRGQGGLIQNVLCPLSATVTLPQATIPVTTTAGAATSGYFYMYNSSSGYVTTAKVFFTGKTANSFTGCTGGTGTFGTNFQCNVLTNTVTLDQTAGQVTEGCYSWANQVTDNNNANCPIVPVTANINVDPTPNATVFNGTVFNYTPYVYPHPLVSGATTGKIISLSGIGLAFGNVTVGNTGTGTLSVSNVGDTVLTVTAISYPTAFSGATSGFVVAPGATTNVTVTFTPASAIFYSGNITVTSDATSGSNTIAVSGTGVPPVGPPPPSKHRKRTRDSYATGM